MVYNCSPDSYKILEQLNFNNTYLNINNSGPESSENPDPSPDETAHISSLTSEIDRLIVWGKIHNFNSSQTFDTLDHH